MKILVTGADGQLGREIRDLSAPENIGTGCPDLSGARYPEQFIFTDKPDLDITNLKLVRRNIIENKVSCIINCAGYTAVDRAEGEPALAKAVNVDAVRNLALVSNEFDIQLVHISTDYIFDGKKSKPYKETDNPNPLSVYGRTKLEGEQEILKHASKSLILRTSWLYSSYGNNFVKTIMRHAIEKGALRVVYDQIGTPTYAYDLAKTILDILLLPDIGNSRRGIYHYSNEGIASWYDFAKAIVGIAGINAKIEPIETIDYPTAAKRPHYSVLNKAKIKQHFDIEINHWHDSLKKCMEKLK